jgi:phytanoyl-CoA hydroxylase
MSEAVLDFDPDTLPWIDRDDADVDGYVEQLKSDLQHWREKGYVIFRNACSHELIDKFLGDCEELFRDRQKYPSVLARMVRKENPITSVADMTDQDVQRVGNRLIDFHMFSVAGKQLIMAPRIVDFLHAVFRDQVVAMQSLTFKNSSEQALHQDFAFVVSRNVSHLAASWIALEDVHEDAGPLALYPGSHRIKKFDWGNGIFKTPSSTAPPEAFRAHIEAEVNRLNLEREIFMAKKGDVLIWHSALAHEGTRQKDRTRTRYSLVAHYTSEPYWPEEAYTPRAHASYPGPLRRPPVAPKRHYCNGAFTFGNPVYPEHDDIFP